MPMTLIENALIEWRDARQAIFNTDLEAKVMPELWGRLGNAESRLMAVSRELTSEPFEMARHAS